MARILLVDDDPEILELGRALLNYGGHETFVADGAHSALRILRRSPDFELVITDATMPVTSGFELIRMIRKESDFDHVSIAMLTGRRTKTDLEMALSLGVRDYIVKPFDPKVFLKKVDDLIGMRASEEGLSFHTVRVDQSAQAVMDVKLWQVSELGVVFRSPMSFRAGQKINFFCDVFSEMDIAPPGMRVFVSEAKDGVFETRASFVDLDEETAHKIKRWLLVRKKKTGRAA